MSFTSAELFPLHARLVPPARAQELQDLARDLLSIDLSARQCADIELLGNGAYTPLRGFMGQAEYESVRDHMRLRDGQFWPMPLRLSIPGRLAAQIEVPRPIALRDAEGVLLAVMQVEEIVPDSSGEDRVYIAGPVEVVCLPCYHDFLALRLTPAEVRARWRSQAQDALLICQTSTLLSPAFFAAVMAVARGHAAHVLWQIGIDTAGGNELADVARIAAHRAQMLEMTAMAEGASKPASLALLPLGLVGGDLRNALFKGVIARNFGASHVGLSGVSADALLPYQTELGVSLIALPDVTQWEKDLLAALNKEGAISPSVVAPAVVNQLRRAYPKRSALGFCVFFTGLSGAGKSTLAKALMAKLLEQTQHQITLLDGDTVRKMLSSELGFSREHRAMNVRRIAYLASEIVKHRGIALCAPIAPYASMRNDARTQVERYGGFFEVHVATPLAVCESRDRKGLYAKARAGLVKEFTGVSDPYETPIHPELSIDTSHITVEDAVLAIIHKLREAGYLNA